MATALEHYNLACEHWKAKQGDAAITELKQALELKPNYREAIFNLGYYHLVESRYDEALPQFQRLTQLDPNDAAASRWLGKALCRKASSSHSREDWISAQEAFQQSILRGPNDADVLDELAIVLLELGQYLEAAKASKAAAKLAPKDKRIAYNQSAIGGKIIRKLLVKGKWKEARQAWKAIC